MLYRQDDGQSRTDNQEPTVRTLDQDETEVRTYIENRGILIALWYLLSVIESKDNIVVEYQLERQFV